MRILILSDIHANLEAFETVLKDAEGDWDKVWFLGDLIGYGPDPNECVARMQELDPIALSGNHDWAVLGQLDISNFNQDARRAVVWAQEEIRDETRDYLKGLPPAVNLDPFTLAHASPRHPVWEYILDLGTASANFEYFDTPFCLVGHTHVPIIYRYVSEHRVAIDEPISHEVYGLDNTRRIINPGSVGQPRDSDPRAAYAILDLEKATWEYRRVVYDFGVTQERMRSHGLPERLIQRLAFGW